MVKSKMILAFAILALSGCGAIHRQELNSQVATIRQQQATVGEQCKAAVAANQDLNPIRDKVELLKNGPEESPPFAILANTNYPTLDERRAIVAWAQVRDDCRRRQFSVQFIPASANPLQSNYLQELHAMNLREGAAVDTIIVALSQGKMTYAEFAQKRYDLGKEMAEAMRQFQQSTMIADIQRQQQAQALAQQQFQNGLQALTAYMQTVQTRQPQVSTTTCNAVGGTAFCTKVSQ